MKKGIAFLTVFCLGVTLCAAPPSVASLIAAYGFSEGTGTTTADASGNGNTGTLVNGVAWAAGGKLSFDGIDDRVNIGTGVGVSTALTLEAWIYIATAPNTAQVILAKSTNYTLQITSPDVGLWVLRFYNGSSFNDSTYLPLNTWTHVAVTVDGMVRFYVNGVLSSSAAGAVGATNANVAWIGWYDGGSAVHQWKGSLDDVRIYNHVLTVAEIVIDMNTPVGSSGSAPNAATNAAVTFTVQ